MQTGFLLDGRLSLHRQWLLLNSDAVHGLVGVGHSQAGDAAKLTLASGAKLRLRVGRAGLGWRGGGGGGNRVLRLLAVPGKRRNVQLRQFPLPSLEIRSQQGAIQKKERASSSCCQTKVGATKGERLRARDR